MQFNKVVVIGLGLPKDTKMFLHSSNRSKSKILTAAMEEDEDYKRHRAMLEIELNSPAIERTSK